MKKIYTLTVASLLAAGTVGAQSLNNPTFHGKVTTSNITKKIPRATSSADRSVSKDFYVDYEYADETREETEFGYTNARYIWDMNMNYNSTTAPNGFKYAVVDFYQGTAGLINDSYGLTDGSGYPYDVNYTAGTLMVDSVFINIGHENNSGTNDTLVVNLISLDGTGYPTSTVLGTKKLIMNSSFTGQTNWLTGGVVGFEFNQMIPAGTKFGIAVKYYGALVDSFGMLNGFVDEGVACPSAPSLPNFAMRSLYWPNSYADWVQYDGSYPLLPSSTSSSAADIFYDCDGNGTFTAGTDSYSFIQNWALWIKVTANVSLASVTETNSLISKLDQNYPNPFSANSVVNYSLASASDVTFTVTDLTGKVVMSQNYGHQTAGQHRIDINGNNLESGVYYYTVTAGTTKETRKMTVVK